MFEVQDQQQVGYLMNPDLLKGSFPTRPLGQGQEVSFQATFLVPDDSVLRDIVLHEPDASPVSARLVPR